MSNRTEALYQLAEQAGATLEDVAYVLNIPVKQARQTVHRYAGVKVGRKDKPSAETIALLFDDVHGGLDNDDD